MVEGDSMHIIKILNNNAVQVINEHGDQVIIVGRGIGHDKKEARLFLLRIVTKFL